MKTVVNTYEVPHLWANQVQSHARNGRNTLWFRDGTIYSYGEHFPIATFVRNEKGEQAVLFTTRSYSITTAQHVSSVRCACNHISPVFHVALASNRWEGKQDPSEYVADYRTRIDEKQNMVARARKAEKREYLYHSLTSLVDEANHFAAFFSLADRFEVLEDFDNLRASLAEVDKAKRKAERERLAEVRRLAEEKIARWKQGENVQLPYSLDTVYLRIEGEELVTSKGARVPVSHARRGLAIVQACRARGEGYKRNGHTIHLGHYAIDEITAEGNVKAGCHRVEWAEIERIAGELGREG